MTLLLAIPAIDVTTSMREAAGMLRILLRTRTAGGRPDCEAPMLEMRPNCECCDKDLSPEQGEVWICSLECTFCAGCADTVLHGTCPNCGGELVRRPRRAAKWLAKYPPSTRRVHRPGGCANVAA